MKKATKSISLILTVLFLSTITVFSQVTFNGNGNTGFGDVIGTGNIEISDDGTTITMVIDRASGALNDGIAIYIDSDASVDLTSTSNLTDSGDDGRKTISGFDGTNRSAITFPNGFSPDYAISLRTDFSGLFQLVESGSHTFVTSANLSGTATSTDDTYTIDIDFSEIGMSSDSTFKFVVTYISATAFRSDEAIGTPISGGNVGANAVTFTGYNTYQSERSISGTAGWRLLSLPKTGGTVTDISDDTAVQGITGGDNTSNDANFYIYDSDGTFEEPTNVSTAWGDGLGFAAYFYNNTTAGSAALPITLDASGSEPSSDVVVDLYSGATGRYTLVGNPFASNIDLADVSANIAISSNMTFWDNTAGSYVTESTTGGLVIEPWQGYWVQTAASTGSGQLTYGTADKTSSASDTTHFDKINPNTFRELKFTIESSYNSEKNLTLQVADDALEGWDSYDLLKLGSLLSQNVSAAFVGELDGETVLKGIESIPSSLDREITLPVIVDLVGESQTLKMSWKGLSGLPEEWSVKLHDYNTEQSFDLRSADEYTFEVMVETSKEKANPITILKSSFGQTMKHKSSQGPRFGITITPTTAVSNELEEVAERFALDQNYPNPFNPSTTINYSVENTGQVSLSVYNVMGQKVAELVNGTKAAGSYNVSWNASGAASGMYYYRLEAGGQVLTRKMTLIK